MPARPKKHRDMDCEYRYSINGTGKAWYFGYFCSYKFLFEITNDILHKQLQTFTNFS